ncbi:type II secretion system F family protein [Parasphingorhabdus pacifica]
MLTLLCLSMSLWFWPDGYARHRAHCARHGAARRLRQPGHHLVRVLPIPAAALGGAVAGVGGVCAALSVAILATRTWRSRWERNRRRNRVAQLAGGLRVLVAELRAGSHPASAAAGAAADDPLDSDSAGRTSARPGLPAPGRGRLTPAGAASGGTNSAATVFRDMAATARLGGDVSELLRDEDRWPELRRPLGRIGRAWELADQHGVALADLLDSVCRDLEHRLCFAGEVEARMAGPRATALVLAGLPMLGLLLGEAVGAAPLAFLAGEPLGQVLLVVGTGLACGGVVWTRRLTESAVPL